MLGNNPFYHALIKKYTALVGTLFNDLSITRREEGREVEFKVPIQYGPADRWLSRVTQDPDLNRQPAVTLPRISFEMGSIMYNADAQLNRITRVSGPGGSAYMWTPYNFNFTVSIMVKNVEDGACIVEQVLPLFSPSFSVTMDLIPELDLKQDIKVLLNSATSTDQYEGNYEERRALIWTLELTVAGYLFGPVTTGGGKKIKIVDVNFFDQNTNGFLERTHLEVRNAANTSIPPAQVVETQPYIIVTETTSSPKA
jgi:hypothetical protein